MFSALDHAMMARALRLAERGRYWARPNPHVGCVITHGEQVVGEGFTQPPGQGHAEVQALAQAGERARGATAYVTLEPCAHFGRTPPCADALISAGVSRVVVALEDPDPRVSGGGAQRLRDAGVQVEVGLLAGQVERQLAGFLLRQRRGRGRLRTKIAMSLDGRTGMASGESQWITGPAARADVQRLRAESCAVVTGIGTVLADDCALTVRADELHSDAPLPPPAQRALRVVADRRLRTPPQARVLAGEQPSLLLWGGEENSPAALAAETTVVAVQNDALDPAAMLKVLAGRDCNDILLESGPTLVGAFIRAALVDELIVYIAPRLLGSQARPMLDLPLERMSEALDLQISDRRQIGNDLRITLTPAVSSAD